MITENEALLRLLQDGKITLQEYIKEKEALENKSLRDQFRALSDHLV
jgi:hypothetical protein